MASREEWKNAYYGDGRRKWIFVVAGIIIVAAAFAYLSQPGKTQINPTPTPTATPVPPTATPVATATPKLPANLTANQTNTTATPGRTTTPTPTRTPTPTPTRTPTPARTPQT